MYESYTICVQTGNILGTFKLYYLHLLCILYILYLHNLGICNNHIVYFKVKKNTQILFLFDIICVL